jgi:hypothetical protein
LESKTEEVIPLEKPKHLPVSIFHREHHEREVALQYKKKWR